MVSLRLIQRVMQLTRKLCKGHLCVWAHNIVALVDNKHTCTIEKQGPVVIQLLAS